MAFPDSDIILPNFKRDYYEKCKNKQKCSPSDSKITKFQRIEDPAIPDLPEYFILKIAECERANKTREVKQLLRSNPHRNILAIYAYEILPIPLFKSSLYLSTECCDRDFRMFLITMEKQILKFAVAIDYCRQLLIACKHIHKLGVVHRDIKPENIYVNNNNGEITLKLGDFGLARRMPEGIWHLCQMQRCILPDMEHEVTTCGSRKYASPEMFEAIKKDVPLMIPKAPFATDIFSLGLVLYEMITKEQLFPDPNDRPEFNLIDIETKLMEKTNLLDLIPMIMGMLHPDPLQRYSATGALKVCPTPKTVKVASL